MTVVDLSLSKSTKHLPFGTADARLYFPSDIILFWPSHSKTEKQVLPHPGLPALPSIPLLMLNMDVRTAGGFYDQNFATQRGDIRGI